MIARVPVPQIPAVWAVVDVVTSSGVGDGGEVEEAVTAVVEAEHERIHESHLLLERLELLFASVGEPSAPLLVVASALGVVDHKLGLHSSDGRVANIAREPPEVCGLLAPHVHYPLGSDVEKLRQQGANE